MSLIVEKGLIRDEPKNAMGTYNYLVGLYKSLIVG